MTWQPGDTLALVNAWRATDDATVDDAAAVFDHVLRDAVSRTEDPDCRAEALRQIAAFAGAALGIAFRDRPRHLQDVLIRVAERCT